MSYLDKRVLLKANLETRSITEEKQSKIFFYNTDENIANLYMKLIYVTDDGLSKELQKDEVSGYSLKMTAIKPKTNQIREVDGVLSEDLSNNEGTCAIFKFQLGTEFTNQIGDVICCTKIIKDAQKLNMDYFVYTIKADKLTGLNAEITSNPDLPVLKQLIKEVKETAQTVNNIDDVNITDTKTFSNKKIEEKFTDVDSQIKDIVNDVNKSNVINLEKYNITQADYEYPFTTENYNVAYQNGVGLQQAIDDAKNNNIQELIIPPGNYPLCYSGDTQECSNPIITVDGVNLKGYGCKLYVIYDELDTGLNPYFTADISLGHTLMGKIFATNSNIEGFELVGERGYRILDSAKYREGSYGIVLTNYTNGNLIKNCKISHFSGDGIGSGGAMQQLATWLGGADALATAITWDGSKWVSSTLSFTCPRHSIGWADISKPMQIRGSSYFIWSIQPLKVHCFKGIKQNDNSYTEGDYIGTIRVNQGEPFYFLENTYYFYIEVVDSAEHETTATSTIGVAIGYGTYYRTTIENCEIKFNTRGGISNLPSGSIVKNCNVIYNGCKFGNMVAFYDGTQFGIDIEDWFIHDITIDNCLIYGNLHGILYRCHKINILNSIVYGVTKSLNYSIDFYANNTRFKGNCLMDNGGASFGVRTALGCKFEGSVSDQINIMSATGVATNEKLGLVKPVLKTDEMTQPVGVDNNGLLYTAPGGNGNTGVIPTDWVTLIDRKISLASVNSILENFISEGNYNYFKIYITRTSDPNNTVTLLSLKQIIVNGISCGAFTIGFGNPQTERKEIFVSVHKLNNLIDWSYRVATNSLEYNQSNMTYGLSRVGINSSYLNKLYVAFNDVYTGDINIIVEGGVV